MTVMTAEQLELHRPIRTSPGNEGDPFFCLSNLAVLRQSIRDADEGRLTLHELIED